jgi:hypothetical protein
MTYTNYQLEFIIIFIEIAIAFQMVQVLQNNKKKNSALKSENAIQF